MTDNGSSGCKFSYLESNERVKCNTLVLGAIWQGLRDHQTSDWPRNRIQKVANCSMPPRLGYLSTDACDIETSILELLDGATKMFSSPTASSLRGHGYCAPNNKFEWFQDEILVGEVSRH